jgi:hypothetical protein
MLRGIRNESKALKELMAFTESFVLWRQSQPDSPEFHVLWTKLAALLELSGLEVMAVRGVPFDPSLHEACAVRFDPNVPDGYVLETVRPGFTSGGEILRSASVVINRFPVVTYDSAETETEDAADEGGEFEEEETAPESGYTAGEDVEFAEEPAATETQDAADEGGEFAEEETAPESGYTAGEDGEFAEEPAATEAQDAADEGGEFKGETETDDRIGV